MLSHRATISFSLCLFLLPLPAFAASLNLKHEGDLFVVENDWARYTIDLSQGAKVCSFLWKGTGTEWCYGGANSGLFMDHLWQQRHPGELQNAPYEYEILSQSASEIRLRFWRDIRSQQDPAIYQVRVERTLTFYADSPAVKAEVTITNPTDEYKRPGFWQQHCFYPGAEKPNVYYFRPCTLGLDLATYAQEDGLWTRHGPDWVKEPVAGWTAVTNPEAREGAVFLMDYNYLRWLYNCLPCWTVEYFYDRVNIPPGQSWETVEYFVPTYGYEGFSHADQQVIAYLSLQDHNLAVHLGAALHEQKNVSVRISVVGYPEGGSLADQSFSLDALTFAPAEHILPLGEQLPGGLLAKVEVTGEGIESNFEQFFAPGISPFDIIPSRVVYRIPKPPKQKDYHFPPKAPTLPWRPSVLFLKGIHSEPYQVEKAVSLLGGQLKKSYFEANVYGHRVDYVPPNIEELFQYNVVMLGNIDYEAVGEDLSAYLRYFVENGGGLLVLGGAYAFGHGQYGGTPLEELLPVASGPTFDLEKARVPLLLQPACRSYICDRLAWEQAPKVAWYHVPAQLKPGARVYARAGGRPMLVGWRLGQGKVLVALNVPWGESSPDTLFWEWDEWPQLVANTVRWLSR